MEIRVGRRCLFAVFVYLAGAESILNLTFICIQHFLSVNVWIMSMCGHQFGWTACILHIRLVGSRTSMICSTKLFFYSNFRSFLIVNFQCSLLICLIWQKKRSLSCHCLLQSTCCFIPHSRLNHQRLLRISITSCFFRRILLQNIFLNLYLRDTFIQRKNFPLLLAFRGFYYAICCI